MTPWYQVVNAPQEFTRARAYHVTSELQRIEGGFAELPQKNSMFTAAFVFCETAPGSVANAYSIVSSHMVDEYVKGTSARFVAEHSNTGPSTLNLNSIGAVSLVGADAQPLQSGDLVAGQLAEAVYDGARFRLLRGSTDTPPIYFADGQSDLAFVQNAEITPVVLSEASGSNADSATYSVSTLPDGLTFDASTRTLSGTPTTIGATDVTYTVTDSDDRTFEDIFTIRVVAELLIVNAQDDLNLFQGTFYSAINLPEPVSGAGGYTYSLSESLLPNGLTFNATAATLSGSPTESGVFAGISFTVTDSAGQTATQTFSITVFAVAPLELPEIAARGFVQNTAITPVVLPGATGGSSPISYSMTGLPAGLTFNQTNRTVSGTPTTLGTVTVTYQAVDNRGVTVSRTAPYTVQPDGKRITAVVDEGGVVTSAVLQAGVEHALSATELTLPDWTGNKKLVIAQPQSLVDLTRIVFMGLGNSITAFTKSAGTVTDGDVVYAFWISNDVQGDVISGESITVG